MNYTSGLLLQMEDAGICPVTAATLGTSVLVALGSLEKGSCVVLRTRGTWCSLLPVSLAFNGANNA